MKKPLSPLAQQLKEYFAEHYSYIEMPTDEIIQFFTDTTYDGAMTPERLADYFQDYLLANGIGEVQE